MKIISSIFVTSLAAVAISGSASASVYFTNFETGYVGGDLNGQQDWSTNGSTTADVAAIIGVGGPFGSRAATIGFVNPLDQNNVYVSNTASTPLVGVSVPNASFSALFQVQDSDTIYGPGAEIRDTFGFRLENASGVNLFSFILSPFDQAALPENDTNFNTYSWSTGVGAPTTVLSGLAAEELFAYTFTVNFFDAGAGDVGFSANINNIDFFSGTLLGLSSETISEFGAFWNTTNGAANSGSNFLIFDNVSLIPEPSSALLGVLGAAFAFGRRRRA